MPLFKIFYVSFIHSSTGQLIISYEIPSRNDFEIKVVYKKRLNCTKSVLLDQFRLAYEKMNEMALEYRNSKDSDEPTITQVLLSISLLVVNAFKNLKIILLIW